jgi:hypothetical protein
MGLWSQEEALTEDQVLKLTDDLARRVKLDFDLSQTYLNAANEIGSAVKVLRLLRTSEAANDPNVAQVVSLLETKLDGYLVTFLMYPEVEKSRDFHRGIIKFLNRARTYRAEFPRDYADEGFASAVKKVLDYAETAGKGQEARPPRER